MVLSLRSAATRKTRNFASVQILIPYFIDTKFDKVRLPSLHFTGRIEFYRPESVGIYSLFNRKSNGHLSLRKDHTYTTGSDNSKDYSTFL